MWELKIMNENKVSCETHKLNGRKYQYVQRKFIKEIRPHRERFHRRHGSHVGEPNQWKGGHVNGPSQSCGRDLFWYVSIVFCSSKFTRLPTTWVKTFYLEWECLKKQWKWMEQWKAFNLTLYSEEYSHVALFQQLEKIYLAYWTPAFKHSFPCRSLHVVGYLVSGSKSKKWVSYQAFGLEFCRKCLPHRVLWHSSLELTARLSRTVRCWTLTMDYQIRQVTCSCL